MPACPLALAAAKAEVRAVADGFAIAIRAVHDADAEKILQRASSLPRVNISSVEPAT